MKKTTILFDLDGTIVDSSEGIFASINYAMQKLGRADLPLDVLKTFVGPPLRESFSRIGFDVADTERAVVYYRELYKKEAMYQMSPYEGIEETLAAFAEEKNIFLATSKPELFAKKMLNHLDFSRYFTGIYGADLEGKRIQKAAVIRYALDSAKIEETAHAVMIGDRKHDILGAIENNLESIGVLYGFGDEKELVQAGANQIVVAPRELLTIIE